MPEEVEEEEVEVEELGVSDGRGAGSESDSEELAGEPAGNATDESCLSASRYRIFWTVEEPVL